MATKFLYIDDDEKNARGIVKSIEDKDLIFKVEPPKSWNEQIEFLIEEKKLNDYDGLLLDLKLEFRKKKNTKQNKNPAENISKIKFTGADLAQAIRTKIKSDKSIKDLPIFLCSTDQSFMAYFDRTSYDLFDRKLDKNKDFADRKKSKETFIFYAQAYKTLNKIASLEKLLNKKLAKREDLSILNSEFKKCKTSHEKIYLLDRFFLKKRGPLISEDVLSIRLGIDMHKSKGWEKFKNENLSKYKYTGILSDYYDRWWNHDMILDFKKKYEVNLKVLDASERVERINKTFGQYNLKPIEKLPNQDFTSFWYKCAISENPMDVLDGLKVIEVPRYSWIEQDYISKEYLMSDERDKKQILALLGPTEREIFENLG